MTRPAKSYYRVMLGRQSAHATECLACGFVGVDFGIDQDLSGQLPAQWALLAVPRVSFYRYQVSFELIKR